MASQEAGNAESSHASESSSKNGKKGGGCPHHAISEPLSPSTGQTAFPVHKTRRDLVRLPEDVNLIFALPTTARHAPYYYMKRGHANRMNRALREITAAGPTVEDGVLKAKEFLKAGESPDLIRHALGIYLTHSPDAQRRKIVVPPLKNHAMFLSQRSVAIAAATADPSALTVVAGEVVSADTMQGPALLSYWREDYDYNDHHIHWHMVFPGTGVVVNGVNVKVIDRQGELFLYMHSQMVARYETEGVCWGLPLVRPWNQYDDVLEFGYVPVPGLKDFYGGYPPFKSWYATKNPNIPDTKDQPVPRALLETWRDNIYLAIKEGYFWTKNKAGESRKVLLTADNCHNIVGIVIEAESEALQIMPDGSSLDTDRYGNLHNFGHDKFAELGYHNYLTATNPYGLMISNFGSPRDPAFWPWHKHIQYFGRLAAAKYPQDITAHKAAVTLSNLSLTAQSEDAPHYEEGGITTTMGPPAVNLMESKAKLDHEPYQWSVQIDSTRNNPAPSESNPQFLTLRLFIAAKELMEDYHNWIEMDKVTATLTTASSITNVRLDTDSSVARKMSSYSELDSQYSNSWCRCGWPQNMMLPVGKVDGMPFVAFCIATDDTLDSVVKTPALSYCGSMKNDRKYPDPRGMGYPFDRVWTQQVADGTEQSISTIISNSKEYPFMASSPFKIFRTTQPYLDTNGNIHPTTNITWYNTIKGYFLPSDVTCMLHEYGYDLSNPDDVALHAAAIYDATVHQRMPLQMPPYTQENPDPKHPLWTTDMCDKFHIWLLSGCPLGTDPGPVPPVNPPPTTATWENTIKDYFLPSDVTCMSSEFDLSKQEDVAKNAAAIYSAVSSQSMPLQMPPYTQENPDPNHPLWTKEMCDTFNAWMLNGCP